MQEIKCILLFSNYHHTQHKGLFALLFFPDIFNMEIWAELAAGHFVFLRSSGLCGSRVNTFNWLGAPMCGAFVMPMKPTELSQTSVWVSRRHSPKVLQPATDSSPKHQRSI